MTSGQMLIALALLASVAALAGALMEFRTTPRAAGGGADGSGDAVGASRWLWLSRASQVVAVAAMGAAVAWLLHLIVTYQFQYSYVSRYSSRDLPLHYLVSTFWAGQEGTFLLWAFYTGLLGLVVTWTARTLASGVLLFVALIQSGLLLILVRLSPFALRAPIPLDGAGLNPLLQDPWMVIHPPLLFLGFAACAVPAAFALHALSRGESEEWAHGALPWTAFSVLILGTPICLGGYWAYRVLGWGGYWGWDPVENGSLIPWLCSVALLHGLVVQTRTGTMRRLNLFLAVASFVLVLYATFLTRSGVLGDFSVHSFLDLGINGYLVALLLGFAAISGALFLLRFRSIAEPSFPPGVLSREYGMFLGALSLLLFALFVLLGTSAPLITRIGGAPANVSVGYYESTSIPFGILFCLGLAVVPQLLWGRNRTTGLRRALLPPLALALVATIVLYRLGVAHPGPLALGGAAALAIFVNLEIVVRLVRGNLQASGGHLTHVGIGLMIVGILTSTVYSRSEPVVLPRGETVYSLGYALRWSGVRPIEGGRREAYDIDITSPKGMSFVASPIMFYSTYTAGVMRRPAIRRFVSHDLYLSPQDVDRQKALDAMEMRDISLTVGERVTIEGMSLLFLAPEPRVMTDTRLEYAACLEATIAGRAEIVRPVVITTGDGPAFEEARLSNGTRVILRRYEPQQGRARFYLLLPGSAHFEQPIEFLHLEVGLKPWINVLWLGTFLAMGGLTLTVLHRVRSARTGGAAGADGEQGRARRHEGTTVDGSSGKLPAEAARSLPA